MSTKLVLVAVAIAAVTPWGVSAFQPKTLSNEATRTLKLSAMASPNGIDRRKLFGAVAAMTAARGYPILPANAEVNFDPAMYGDQELRVGTVDSVREKTRRAILQNPKLAPAFYQLALLDGLSFDVKSSAYGPNGSVIYAVLNSKDDGSMYLQNLKDAAGVLIQAEKDLKKKVAVSIADCVAIAGAEAIESIGGPVLPVQLGRLDIGTVASGSTKIVVSPLPIDILSGARSVQEVRDVFRSAGLTEREMTALLGGLMTLEIVEKTRTTEDWKESAKPKFVERGKMGRMSDYKRLTDADIRAAEQDEFDEDPDDGWYIADSFGTRDDRFGNRIAKDEIDEKSFNKYMKELYTFVAKKKGEDRFGWIGRQIMDPDSPTAQSWLKKYADSNLSYTKDLIIAFNSVTQLGAVYTGGKYENLLKNRPRKSLNDDDLNLFK